MQAITFLKEIEHFQSPVLSFNDVVKVIGKSKEYSRVYIHRLKQKKIITEIEKGKYALSEEPFEIASNLVFPSYISFIGAYYIYGFTTQIPVIAQIVCQNPKKEMDIGQIKVNFISFKNERIFGYKRERFRNKYIFIAEPEKAIIDSLYLPKYCPLSESYEALKRALEDKKIDIYKLLEYGLRMNSIITLKRLGYLLEVLGIDIYDKVKHKLNKRYDLLNPFMKTSKKNSSKWKLNINEVFE